jgi:GNAT superfamily N-acetyltransferase
LIRYRSFQNWDPPALAEIWRTQPPLRGRVQAVTPQLLEQHVFAKPWFDRQGLIVACEGARPVGFVHAGFGVNKDLDGIDFAQGTTCLLHVAPHERRAEISMELLTASEDYLRRTGAQQLFAGMQFPLSPFYHGFYGSCDVPGVLGSDSAMNELLAAAGYQSGTARGLFRRQLAGFKPPIDPQWMKVRRRFVARHSDEVLPDNWWEANVWAWHDLTRFVLTLPDGGEPIISATFWDIQPLAVSWGVQAAGLVQLDDTPEARDEGLTTYLLADALRYYQTKSYAQVEALAAPQDQSLRDVLAKLGFAEYDTAALWRK